MGHAQALKVDPDQPVHSVTTLARLLDDTMQQDRFAMLFVALFAAAGVITSATGVPCWRTPSRSANAKSASAWHSVRRLRLSHG